VKSQKSKTVFPDKNPIHPIIQSFNHAKSRILVWLYGCMQFLSIKFILFIVSALLLSACDKAPPIPEEKFIKVYVDLLIIQDTTTADTFSLDSIRTLVFTRHDISSEQYDETIDYYNSQPEKWTVFFDSATSYVEGLKKEAEN
jgi:Domain of unknown function (DUF4296)